MGYRQCSEFCLSCQRAAIFHDFRLSLFWRTQRPAAPFLAYRLMSDFYSAIALLYIALFTSINMELALKNLLQKPVFYHLWFFLRDCGDLSGFTADSGEERRRKNVAGANGGDWHYR